MATSDGVIEAAPNPGAGAVVLALILLVASAALQSSGAMLGAAVLFIGAVAYRRASAPDRPAGSERQHLAISTASIVGLLVATFIVFVAAALLATR